MQVKRRTLSSNDLGHMFRAGDGYTLRDVLGLLRWTGEKRGLAAEVAERGILTGGAVRGIAQVQHREFQRSLQGSVAFHVIVLLWHCETVEIVKLRQLQ